MDVAHRAGVVMAELERRWGRHPDGVWVAPGRVNIIGEHTDYNGGFVLPVAIDRETVVAAARRTDGMVRVWSAQRGEAAVPLDDVPLRRLGWEAHVAGVAWVLREQGARITGADLAVDSDVPVGSGVSSSAALECAVALAFTQLAGDAPDPLALALAAQRAERDVVGAPVGLMDHAAALMCRAGAALFLDCRTLHHELVPLQIDGHELVVIDTGVEHEHASGGYRRRRAECDEAARLLDVELLRDADRAEAEALPAPLNRRVRHVITENERVRAAVEALRSGDCERLGALLVESHASLRDDFEVSVAALDIAVEAAMHAGAVGARLTGGGFGGSVVALVPTDAVDPVSREVSQALTDRAANVFVVHASDAARRVTPS